MDLRFLDKSPEVAPLLVRLYDSHRIYNLARDTSPSARAELTNVVAELLETKLDFKEKELVCDVLISLIRQAEKDLRAAISERLSVFENTPLRLALHIANDEIDVAAPMLEFSRILSDMDLIYLIKSQDSPHWEIIARRAGLGDRVIDMLADTRDVKTSAALAGNNAIRLTEHAFRVLCDAAQASDAVGRPLLMRSDMPEHLARKLYACVSDELKRYIRDYFGVQDQTVQAAIDDISFEFTDHVIHRQFMPSSETMDAVRDYVREGRLTAKLMMETLSRGQYASFIAMFSQFTGCGLEQVHDMLADPSGRMLAVVCKACGLNKSELSRFYMMTQRLRTEDRIVDQNELRKCLATFDKVDSAKARQALGMEKPH